MIKALTRSLARSVGMPLGDIPAKTGGNDVCACVLIWDVGAQNGTIEFL